MYHKSWIGIVAALLVAGCSTGSRPAQSNMPAIAKQPDGIVIPVGDSFLKLQVCADNIIRVVCSHDRAFFNRRSIATDFERPANPVQWDMARDGNEATLSTAKLKARVNLTTGAVSFLDSAGKPILAEKAAGRSLEPVTIQDEQTYHVRQQWEPNTDESLYGLGQHQLGLTDIKGYDLDLWQHNGTVIVPLLVSSRGYGIFWDNTSFTRFGDLRDTQSIPADQLFDMAGKQGGLTGSYYAGANFDRLVATRVDPKINIAVESSITSNQSIHPDLPKGDISVRWEGDFQTQAAGDYSFHGFSNGGIKLWIDNKLVMDHWRQGWLPWIDVARPHLEANRRYHIKLEWTKDQGMATMQLKWKTPSTQTATSLWSEVGEAVDYYFIYGPKLDNVVAGYRDITGKASMMPAWAFGLWQSRQRYETSKASLDVVEGFRSRHIPFDNIVQDWFYWNENAWGSHEFDSNRFPDPQAWINAIHDNHSRLMISVWGKFYPGTQNFQEMHSRGYLYEPNLKEHLRDWLKHPYTFYDAFNPEARKLFWSQVNRELFAKHVDAWWMDATEPDLLPTPTLDGQRTHMNPTALGSGSRMLNGSPLVNSKGVYEGQRAAAPDQRVFILTRSGFAGMQRYAAATWSGDITSTWTALAKQIPAGLGFSLSGMPYWTMDIGGFAVPGRFSDKHPKPQDAEEWRELNARWFEFGAFVPLLRVHGEFPYREMWEFGGEQSPTYLAQLKFDRIRYRLLPYIYSLAGSVTQSNNTIMRPLVMDFPADAKVRAIGDQYLFGPSMMVSPITTYKARARTVYLPQSQGWYDFWTGSFIDAAQSIQAPAPFDSIPLHIKAGSIIPTGPELQYTGEKAADRITLYVYTGANADFTLYEDDGLTNAWENGNFSQIPLHWDDASQTLTIANRQGSFKGMLDNRTFDIVFISKEKPVGFSFDPTPDQTIQYNGQEITVHTTHN